MGEAESFFKSIENVPYHLVQYKQFREKSLELLIAFPSIEKPKACFLFIHGGGWRGETLARLKPHALYAARQGMVGVSLSYRLMDDQSKTDVRDGLEDCIDALEFVRCECRKKYGEIRYIAIGDSAGAYYAECLGCQKILDEVRKGVLRADCVVDLNGIVDLTGKWEYGIRLKRTDTKPKREIETSFSPLYQISKGDAPVLIVHGDMDKTVDISDARAYKKALDKAGVPADLYTLNGAAHAFILFDYRHSNDFVVKVIKFIFEYIAKKL